MVLEAAAKAEAVATATSHGRNDVIECRGGDVTFNCVLAVWRWTPFEVIVVINVRTVQ